MLQAIRSQAGSFVIRMLFALLIVAFGVWGIGDIFRNRSVDTSVAKVGDHVVKGEELTQAVQDELKSAGGQIDIQTAKQFGIVGQTLQRLVNKYLIDTEIDHLQLALGESAVKQAIVATPDFQTGGKFDKQRMDLILAEKGMTEAQYAADLHAKLVHSELLSPLVDGLTIPAAEVDLLFRSEAEHRIADTFTVPPSAVAAVPTPSDAQVSAFYDAHKETFRIPELRSFKVALLRVEDVAARLDVPEGKLRAEYDNRSADFHVPEERHLQQLVLPDEAKAKDAEAQIAGGKSFASVAKAVAGQDEADLDLGWIKRTDKDMPAAVLDAAFDVKDGSVTAPVQSTYGWHIVHVAGVKPEVTKAFDTVKAQLRDDLARIDAADQIGTTVRAIEDEIAGGGVFADVVKKYDLKVVTVGDVAQSGNDAAGKPVDLPQPKAPVLQTAFETADGQMSQLGELDDNSSFLVTVDKVTPSVVRPLAEVRDQVVGLWQAEQRNAALETLAAGLVQKLKDGKSLKDIAAPLKLTVSTTEPLSRTGGNAKVPPALVAKLFSAKPGEAASAAASDGIVIAQLKDIRPADPATDKAGVDTLTKKLDEEVHEDLAEEYDAALRQHIPVVTNQANIDKLF